MRQGSIVVYTVITAAYDRLRAPRYVSPGCDYVCYFEGHLSRVSHWQIRPLPPHLARLPPPRRNRHIKILPHVYFPDTEYSVYVDGSMDIIGDMTDLVSRQLTTHPIALFAHPNRQCVYEEADECIRLQRDTPERIRRQMEEYRRAGHPAASGLVAGGVIVRRHHSPEVIRVMEAWWQELERHSHRDQLSFNVVARRHRLTYATIPGSVRSNSYTVERPHRLSFRTRLLGKLSAFIRGRQYQHLNATDA